jgi:hypothetical protein
MLNPKLGFIKKIGRRVRIARRRTAALRGTHIDALALFFTS